MAKHRKHIPINIDEVENPYKANTGPSWKEHKKDRRIRKFAEASRRRNRK